jgi:hypothetical protein
MNRLIVLFIFTVFIVLNATGCTNSSEVMEQEQKKNIEVVNQELEGLKKEFIQVKAERDQLAGQLQEYIKKHEGFNHRLLEAYRVQLLFTPPMNLPMYYSITPEPDIQDGWYAIKQPSTIQLNGYVDATSIRFMYTIIGTDMEPQTLDTDKNSSDGWRFQWMSLPEAPEGIAFWAEVMWADGNVKHIPIMPIEVDTSAQ